MPVLDKVIRGNEVEVIYCWGRIVRGETDELRTAARGAIQNIGKVVIHLGDVPNIDSTGLGLLASLCVSARKVSADLKLVAPSAQVAEALKITKLGRLFEIYPTEEAALETFGTRPAAE